MKFYVEQRVLDFGVKILFVTMENINNTGTSQEYLKVRKEKLQQLYEAYADLDVHSDPVLEGFNILHDHAGVKRRKNIPASENLIRLLKKNHGELPFINTAVDIYNLISLETKLALGAHDIDRTEGNVTLRLTDGSEKYVPLGHSEPVANAAGEYCYCDDSNEILCRLEIRQVNKTAADENTVNLFYIVQGNAYTTEEDLEKAADQIITMTQHFCGGEGKVIVPEVI